MTLDINPRELTSAEAIAKRLANQAFDSWEHEYGPEIKKIREIQVLAEALDHKVKLLDLNTNEGTDFQQEFSYSMEGVFVSITDAIKMMENQNED